MRYFVHIKTSDDFLVDWEGEEFDTPLEASNHGEKIACELRMDGEEHRDAEVWVVDVYGLEIVRHPVRRRLAS